MGSSLLFIIEVEGASTHYQQSRKTVCLEDRMRKITCEVCGSNSIEKQEEYYVCQHCGTEYSLEEARKLIGTVKIDKSEDLEKYIVLGNRALDEFDVEGGTYFSKALEIDPNNYEAIAGKALINAFESVRNHDRRLYPGVLDTIGKALSIMNESDLPEAKKSEKLYTYTEYANRLVVMLSDIVNKNLIPNSVDDYNSFYDLQLSFCNDWSTILKFKDKVKTNETSDYLTLRKTILNNIILISVQCCSGSNRFELDNHRRERFLALYHYAVSQMKTVDIQYSPPKIRETATILSLGNTAKPTNKTGACYVATAIYGSYDCPQVWTLRRYRDFVLAKTMHGRAFVKVYYYFSPRLLKYLKGNSIFRKACKTILDYLVNKLQSQGTISYQYSDDEYAN